MLTADRNEDVVRDNRVDDNLTESFVSDRCELFSSSLVRTGTEKNNVEDPINTADKGKPITQPSDTDVDALN